MSKTIKQVLDDMLARREYSLLQVRRKLLAKGFLEQSVNNIVAEYESRGYLSNERYGEQRAYALIRNGYGPYYVRQKLKQEGVELKGQFDWKEAYQVAKRKAGNREGQALKQYLFRRGFGYENID